MARPITILFCLLVSISQSLADTRFRVIALDTNFRVIACRTGQVANCDWDSATVADAIQRHSGYWGGVLFSPIANTCIAMTYVRPLEPGSFTFWNPSPDSVFPIMKVAIDGMPPGRMFIDTFVGPPCSAPWLPAINLHLVGARTICFGPDCFSMAPDTAEVFEAQAELYLAGIGGNGLLLKLPADTFGGTVIPPDSFDTGFLRDGLAYVAIIENQVPNSIRANLGKPYHVRQGSVRAYDLCGRPLHGTRTQALSLIVVRDVRDETFLRLTNSKVLPE